MGGNESDDPLALELEVLGWFKDWIGYPPNAAGALVSDDSTAHLTALACARETLGGGPILYLSDQTHSAIVRAARLLGLDRDQVRVLPSDERFRLTPETLRAAIAADLARGLTPFCVVAQGGAASTGAVDPFEALAEVCSEHGAWLHVDASYGGFTVLADPGLLPGVAHTNSIAIGLHQGVRQSFECGCVLVRSGHDLDPPTRSDALEACVSLRSSDLEALRNEIRRALDVSATAAQRVEESPTLELLAPPSLGVVCFRRRDLDEAANAALASDPSHAGLISTTHLHGRFALRMGMLDQLGAAEDVEATLAFLETAESQIEPARERRPTILSAWPGLPQADVPSLRELPLFGGLEPGQAAQVAARASLREVATGEPVIEQWDLGAEFFVIVEGTVKVTVDGQQTRELGRGDFVGELRALEWGAGYAYPRLASVLATSPVRLLVFPEGVLAELVERYPALDRVIREAAAERLRRHS